MTEKMQNSSRSILNAWLRGKYSIALAGCISAGSAQALDLELLARQYAGTRVAQGETDRVEAYGNIDTVTLQCNQLSGTFQRVRFYLGAAPLEEEPPFAEFALYRNTSGVLFAHVAELSSAESSLSRICQYDSSEFKAFWVPVKEESNKVSFDSGFFAGGLKAELVIDKGEMRLTTWEAGSIASVFPSWIKADYTLVTVE